MPDHSEKFLFNVHCFDDDVIEDDKDEVPPPPVFSEEDLLRAQKQAFTEGHAQALEESKASRTHHLAAVMDKIAADMTTLFAQEARREQLYMQDAVRLALRIFQKLFPLYHEKYGFDELKAAIEDVLQDHAGQKEVTIHVHPDLADGVQSFLDKLHEKNPTLRLQVTADESFGLGACRLSWADGGALQDSESKAEQICALVKQALAGANTKVHDRDGNKESASNSAPPDDGET